MARAWIFQRQEQVRQAGEKGAPWYVGWIDPDKVRRHKSCGAGPEGKRLAGKLKRKIEAELLTGTYGTEANKTWAEFRAEYQERHLPSVAPASRRKALDAMDNFERLIKPGRLSGIKTATVDLFRSRRRQEPSKRRRGQLVCPASVNTDLRYLRAALGKAKRWGYLKELPLFGLERQPKHLPVYLAPDDFARLYAACEKATLPAGQPYAPADWWRGLLAALYLTGWRVSAVLSLPRADVDLDAGTALSRAEDNKGARDQLVPLHPVLVEHLRRLPGFTDRLFPWPHGQTTLYAEFGRLCAAAGVALPAGHRFHALKRAFCTLNAARLDEASLQWLAQHASFETTRRYYINPAARAAEAVGRLFVPDVLRARTVPCIASEPTEPADAKRLPG